MLLGSLCSGLVAIISFVIWFKLAKHQLSIERRLVELIEKEGLEVKKKRPGWVTMFQPFLLSIYPQFLEYHLDGKYPEYNADSYAGHYVAWHVIAGLFTISLAVSVYLLIKVMIHSGFIDPTRF